VIIECKPAIEVIGRHDGPETLFYVDPPYIHSTRNTHGNAYGYEMSNEDHISLAGIFRRLKGKVVLSGYPSELYDGLYPEWQKAPRSVIADGGAKRTELLWLSPTPTQDSLPCKFIGINPLSSTILMHLWCNIVPF